MKFASLNNSLKVGILTILVSLIGLLATFFLFFNDYKDIPLGIILGGIVIGGLNLLSGWIESLDEKRKSTNLSIIMIIVRFVIIISVMLLIAFMYYRWGHKLFNIFSVLI